jgi:PAS domain S-box-containing protein
MESTSKVHSPVEILIAEDSPTQAEQLKYLLEESGYAVRVAPNGRLALDMAKDRKPTLIVSDVVMPEMNGYQLCRAVKGQAELKDTPVILVTSHANSQEVLKGLECGADNFIRKPFNGKELLSRINYILTNQDMRASSKVQAGVEISFGGTKHFVTAERQQILDLLIATYEDAVVMNGQLKNRQGELARSNQMLHGLYRIAEGLSHCLTVQEVLDKSLEMAMELPGIQAGWIALWEDGTGFRPGSTRDLPPALQSPAAWEGDCLCRRVMMSGEMTSAVSMFECERLKKAVGDKQGLRFHATIPLKTAGHFLGVMNLAGPQDGMFGREDLELLEGVGNQLAVALERAQLLERLEWRVEERTAALEAEFAERKRAEEAQLASDLRYRRLFESAKDGILILDARSGEIVDVNPFMEELLGSPHQEFLKKQLWEVGLFENRESCEASIHTLQEAGVIRHGLLTCQSKDGRKIDVEFVGNAYAVGDEKVIQCNVRDISKRRQAEEAARRLAAIVESSEDAIIGKTLSGMIQTWNRGAERLYGYAAEEIIGRPVSILVPPRLSDEISQIMEKVRRGEGVEQLETERVRKDGKTIHVSVTASPVEDTGGVVVGASTITRDITERKLLEEQLRQAQKMEAIGRLAGGVAHDFNNLLTIINGYADLMLEKIGPADPERAHVEEIKKAGARAAWLTRQLLAFGRRQTVAPQVLNLNELVVNLDQMLRRLIGENIDLITGSSKDLDQVKVDPGQVEQIVMNLAVNARDAMPEGGKLTIETENVELDEAYCRSHAGVTPGSYVLLAVSDTGTGMDSETQAHMFEPFFTTKEKGKGTGLGLSIVYGIVKQSGGHVWVYSEPGRGTTMKVYFPRVLEKTETVPRVRPVAASSSGSETILVVEDEDAVRSMVCQILSSKGYHVLQARNGEDALDVSGHFQGPIHLLLTDVVMPGMSGNELAERLETLYRKLKSLYMSGYTDNAIVHNGVLNAGTFFLQKPFTPEALVQKVREVLDADLETRSEMAA